MGQFNATQFKRHNCKGKMTPGEKMEKQRVYWRQRHGFKPRVLTPSHKKAKKPKKPAKHAKAKKLRKAPEVHKQTKNVFEWQNLKLITFPALKFRETESYFEKNVAKRQYKFNGTWCRQVVVRLSL